jgi:hypothetical protein
MDYTRIYNQIIERAQTRKLEGYFEKHHIIPKCIGGLDIKENIVELTAREHFLCHILLCEIYPQEHKLKQALFLMARNKKYPNIINSKLYEELKISHLDTLSKTHKNKQLSQHTKDKISQKPKGKPKPDYFREIASKSRKGKNISEDHKDKIREAMLGKTYPQEIKDKMSLIYYQRDKDTLEKTKQAISLAKSSPVLQYSIDGEFIQEWPSIKQAYTTYKGDISACCQGKQKTAAGFVWKYKHK